MSKQALVISLLAALVILPAITSASDREDDVKRIDKSAQVFKEIMNTPDKGIPNELLETANCIAIIPGELKFALILGVTMAAALPRATQPGDGARQCLWLSAAAALDTRSEVRRRIS
jgi:lipid-binding SYLF domain-containing protein